MGLTPAIAFFFTYATMLIGSLALMGIPLLAGFYSRGVTLEIPYASYLVAAHFAYRLGSFDAFCTAFYPIRLPALAAACDQLRGQKDPETASRWLLPEYVVPTPAPGRQTTAVPRVVEISHGAGHSPTP